MNENKENKEKKWSRLNGEKKFYLFTAIGCAAVLLAIIVIAIAVTASNKVENTGLRDSTSTQTPADANTDEKPSDNEPVVVVPEGMTLPVDGGSVINDYGFYHNQTLNNYYEHEGVDFLVTVGSSVKAVDDGTVESIYKDDIFLGTEIVVNHGDGVKTVYRFVSEKEGLKVGDKVKRGQVIATVAEANGNEYKDGAHLHFEVYENGKNVDPTLYITLEEK